MEGPKDEPEEPAIANKASKARGARVTILTDLPEKLPVIPAEVALITAFLSELVVRLAMNDNGEDQ